MSKEITFAISGTKKELNRTSVTKMVWDEAAGMLTDKDVGGVAVLTATCILDGATAQEKALHLDGFIDRMAKNKYITQADALRAKNEFGLQNVKAARAA